MEKVSPENTRPHWLGGHSVSLRYLISRQEGSRLRLLTLLTEDGDSLPVFGSEVAARAFLRFNRYGEQWRVRESTAGELVSLLMGHIADVKLVVLDPPLAVSDGNVLAVEPVSKRDFINTLIQEPILLATR